MVHISADLSLYSWIVQCSGHPDTLQSTSTYSHLSFPSSTWKRSGVCMCKLGVICHSQERLKIEVKLLFSANRKSYMPRRLAQQPMTFSDLEWPFHDSSVQSVWEGRANVNALCTLSTLKSTLSASRAISVVVEHIVVIIIQRTLSFIALPTKFEELGAVMIYHVSLCMDCISENILL